MLAAAAVTWLTGLLLGRLDTLFATTRPELSPAGRKTFKKQLTGAKRLAVGGGAAVLLGVFLWLKYWPFAARSIAALLDRMPGALSLTVPSYVLPLGISFVTLMAVGYLVDVYRGSCRPAAITGRCFPSSASGPMWWKVPSTGGTACPGRFWTRPGPPTKISPSGCSAWSGASSKKRSSPTGPTCMSRRSLMTIPSIPAWQWWWEPCCTPCSCTPSFPAAWTLCWARPSASAFRWPKTSVSPFSPARWGSSGAAGTSRWAPGCGNTCSSR